MRFIRPRVVTRVANGVLPNGEQATRVDQDVAWLNPDVPQDPAQPSVVIRKAENFPSAVLSGDEHLVDVKYVKYTGSSLHLAASAVFRDVPTVALGTSYPTVEPGNDALTDVQLASLNKQPVFFAPINGAQIVYVHANVSNLGTSTDVRFLIEFEDPDFPGFWIPSKESAPGTPDRDDISDAANEWIAGAVGSYVFQTRAEHRHFRRFRVRCRSTGAMSSAGRIDLGYAHDGGRSTVPEQ